MTTEKIKSLLLMNENKKITVTLLAKKMNVSKAIEKIAEQEDKDVSTIWKNYYPKVKDKINEMLDYK